ncbi:MAG: hypothetical protein DKM50_07615 [Candidatus Margulisiibacteriota bacterium]|nr:MAG: hypothetical protein A2X43_08905 [Candidatus Margulisbacteria bacterium GWD2_39_127]OGI02545.1 MAG: hypothetical protein A2X42_08170 [Candidatus Margulisbacteria bacterium GWF2_38_17]OGI11451.1 MAG: hypothetical protein A2X41_11680 [Candidatus Margulisbacteria bacterium GWE2_39_32]PZM79757.1 MAG: hypothetical protein DKM50_07615 [Candidatus Margulisiibacteriota bacterium]HAR64246.1 hypothetical protein [Candidatus Margulisiibacteriota bacterium]
MSSAVKISDDLYKKAKIIGQAEHRSIAGQIEYWAKLGKMVKENPDLHISFIEDLLISEAEFENKEYTEFKFDTDITN